MCVFFFFFLSNLYYITFIVYCINAVDLSIYKSYTFFCKRIFLICFMLYSLLHSIKTRLRWSHHFESLAATMVDSCSGLLQSTKTREAYSVVFWPHLDGCWLVRNLILFLFIIRYYYFYFSKEWNEFLCSANCE